MRPHSFLIAAMILASSLGLIRAADDKPNEIEGMWMIAELTIDGNVTNLNDLQLAPNVVITADKFQISGRTVARYTLAPDGTPKLLDMRIGDDPNADISEGIYKLADDTLTMCLRPAGGVKDRPTDFASTPGSGLVLSVLKRMK